MAISIVDVVFKHSGPLSQISQPFIQGMFNRMATSYHKYGKVEDNIKSGLNTVGCLEERLQKYYDTGNTEWLMDVANFAMMEYMFPQHENAHFKSTSSEESPGIVFKDGRRTHRGKAS